MDHPLRHPPIQPSREGSALESQLCHFLPRGPQLASVSPSVKGLPSPEGRSDAPVPGTHQPPTPTQQSLHAWGRAVTLSTSLTGQIRWGPQLAGRSLLGEPWMTYLVKASGGFLSLCLSFTTIHRDLQHHTGWGGSSWVGGHQVNGVRMGAKPVHSLPTQTHPGHWLDLSEGSLDNLLGPQGWICRLGKQPLDGRPPVLPPAFAPCSLGQVTLQHPGVLGTPGHVVVQSLSRVRLFVSPWTAAHQAFLSFNSSWSLLKPVSIES